MSQTVEIVRHYSLEIRDGRTIKNAYEHLQEEVGELGLEIENGSAGEDGVKGEVMDVLNCALDILFLAHPEITMKQIDALMEAKCRKWMSKYSDQDQAIPVEGMEETATLLEEYRECEVPVAVVAQIAGTESNSVRRVLAGSHSSRRTRARLNGVHAVLTSAFGEFYYGVARFWRTRDTSGRTLQELLASPVVDLPAVRDHLEEHAAEIERFKSGYAGYRRDGADA